MEGSHKERRSVRGIEVQGNERRTVITTNSDCCRLSTPVFCLCLFRFISTNFSIIGPVESLGLGTEVRSQKKVCRDGGVVRATNSSVVRRVDGRILTGYRLIFKVTPREGKVITS